MHAQIIFSLALLTASLTNGLDLRLQKSEIQARGLDSAAAQDLSLESTPVINITAKRADPASTRGGLYKASKGGNKNGSKPAKSKSPSQPASGVSEDGDEVFEGNAPKEPKEPKSGGGFIGRGPSGAAAIDEDVPQAS